MLSILRVKNFAIIESLEVEFFASLNVLTGETGAGKSILVDALKLVLGAKGRPEMIRSGQDKAEIEALFQIVDHDALKSRFETSGIEFSDISGDGELLVQRVLSKKGRSRTYINGKLSTLGQLRALASGLADISSQHEYHSLTQSSGHLRFLDAYGGLLSLQAQMQVAYRDLSEAVNRWKYLSASDKEKTDRKDLLEFQVREIEDAGFEMGDDEALTAEYNRLQHAKDLFSKTTHAEELLYSDDQAMCSSLAKMQMDLEEASQNDPALEPMARQLDDAKTVLEELARDLGKYAQGIVVDPERLLELEERLESLSKIKRKYGGSLDAALDYLSQATLELNAFDSHEEQLKEVESEKKKMFEKAKKVAIKLHKKRKEVAAKLGSQITDELQSLGMGEAQVRVELKAIDHVPENKKHDFELDGMQITERGVDEAEFLIAPNPGEDAKPLGKIASGGELSRSLLAIKRVLSGLGPKGLYVFDEVDAGVGGAVAEMIGQKIKDVSKHHQVICITHLPQIAAFADEHFVISKQTDNGRTVSQVDYLESKERKKELARMLGGQTITKKTEAAAAEMLKTARAEALG